MVHGTTDERILKLIEDHGPLGAPYTEAIATDLRGLYYNTSNRAHRERARQQSCILVGRKGSGKTSLLYGAVAAPESAVILREGEVYSFIMDAVRALESTGRTCGVEHMATIWEATLEVAAMVNVAARDDNAPAHLCRFVRGLCDGTRPELPSDPAALASDLSNPFSTALSSFLSRAASAFTNAGAVFAMGSTLGDVQSEQITLEEARDELTRYQASRKDKILILIDSMEDLGPNFESQKRAVRAILKLVNRGLRRRSPIQVIVCLPAELPIRDTRSNPIKDRSSEVSVSWSSNELLTLCGQRLRIFMTLMEPTGLEGLGFDLWSRSSPAPPESDEALFRRILPDRVNNSLGYSEPTISYVLRHTQLLPRHALVVFNDILSAQFAAHGTVTAVKPSIIPRSIQQSEEFIAEDILSAYAGMFDEAKQILEHCGSQLGLVFTHGEMYTVFNRNPFKNPLSYGEFLRQAQAIGAIGRVIDIGDIYAKAEFTYSGSVVRRTLNEHDTLSMHPVFSAHYGSPDAAPVLGDARPRSVLAVHPVGSGAD